jgi:hypothetical protein
MAKPKAAGAAAAADKAGAGKAVAALRRHAPPGRYKGAERRTSTAPWFGKERRKAA